MVRPIKLSFLNIGSRNFKFIVGGCIEEGSSVVVDYEMHNNNLTKFELIHIIFNRK